MHSPIPHIPKIKALNLPDLKPIETDSVPKKQGQSLKEWAMAGGGVPEQYKGREHVWHKKVASFAAGGEAYNTNQDMSDNVIQAPAYARGGEVHMQAGGASKMLKPLVDRLSMHFKDVTKRVPELTEAAKQIQLGEMTANQYDKLVNKHKPVKPYESIPKPATADEALGALKEDQRELYGTPSSRLQAGHPVGLRLDIPAYRDHGVWVPAVHEQGAGFKAGDRIGYENVAGVTNPTFGMHEHGALNIASGKPKSTIATIKGGWNPMSEEDAVARAQEYLNHPEWRQVGMDPERHSYFYDRETMQPITGAEEAIQIGPLVLAKKPQYGNKKDFKYADGGEVHMAKGGDPRGEMRATPEYNPQAAGAARALKMAHEFASRPFGYRNPPGEMLSEFLGVPDVANTLERMGYGEPMTTGRGMTTKPREEALNAAMAVAPLAQMTKGMPVGAIIKPKGGNWYKTPPNGASVEGSIERLRPYQKQDAIIEHYKGLGQDTSEHEKRHAINQWVENNLQNYVKKQMGTMDDPIRALHEQGITHMPKDVREGLGEVERDTMERRVAAGFPKEGVAKSDLAKEWENLADQNIWSSKAGDVQHAQTVMPELQKADRALKNHEDMLTMRFRQKLAENPDLSSAERRMLEEKMPMSQKAAIVGDEKHDELLQNRARLASVANGGDWHIGQNNPWVANLPPETDLHQGIASGMGFDHVIDILKQEVEAGRIRPEQLNKISISDAVRRTHEFDQEIEAKLNASRAAAREGLPVHKEYPEGYRWVELNKPGSFSNESEAMGHSVRGYEPSVNHPDWIEQSGDMGSPGYGHGGWEAIKSGKAKVYSLVDPKGAPHATIEVGKPELRTWDDVTNAVGKEKAADLHKEFYDIGADRTDNTDAAMAMFLKNKGIEPLESISQIKGKQNAAPKDEYLPYVQDFVRSGKWSDVGDLSNTGLYSSKDVVNHMPESFTMSRNARTLAIGRARQANDMPEYMTKAEYETMLQKHAPEDIWAAEKAQRAAEDDQLLRELRPPEEPHLAGGGLLKAGIRALMEEAPRGVEPIVVKAAERAAAGKKAAEQIKAQPQVKASEALGQAMEKGFKRTTTTQADRTRVGGGNIGGAAFPAISEADPLYAGKVWGVMDEGTAARLKNLTDPETAWTTMLGSANQLKTNPIVFDKLKKQFLESMKAGNLSPELESKINHNLAVTFGEGAEIRDPKIWKQADTFEKRAALADLMMGQGLPPKKGGLALGGEKSGRGVIFKPTETLIRETEPSLLHPEHGGEAPTFAAGPRLFSMEQESQYRPDLHPGFPTLITGKDLGVNMMPTPTEVYLPDWHRKFKADNPDRKAPGYYDLALGVKGQGLPSQEINDEFIRHLLREGFKAGGAVGGLSAATKSCSCHD